MGTAYLTFSQNILMALGPSAGGVWLTPTWTLAVEEQFYLVLPVIIMLTPRRALAPVLVSLCAASLLFRWAVYDVNEMAALTLLPSRADLLLSGVLAAMAERRWNLVRCLLGLRLAPLGAVLALIALRALGGEKAFVIAGPPLLGAGAACFILCLAHGAPEGRRFRSPVLVLLGAVSYGLYLFHQPISGLLHGALLGARPDIASPAAIGVSVAAVALSLAAAAASWVWVEAPILAWARRRAGKTKPAGAAFTPAG